MCKEYCKNITDQSTDLEKQLSKIKIYFIQTVSQIGAPCITIAVTLELWTNKMPRRLIFQQHSIQNITMTNWN